MLDQLIQIINAPVDGAARNTYFVGEDVCGTPGWRRQLNAKVVLQEPPCNVADKEGLSRAGVSVEDKHSASLIRYECTDAVIGRLLTGRES